MPDNQNLLIAVKNGNLSLAKEYLDILEVDIDFRDKSGTLLHHAVRSGNTELVELLLLKKADPNLGYYEYKYSRTVYPIESAITQQQLDIIYLLIEHGADVKSKIMYYECLLFQVISYTNFKQLVNNLIKAGAPLKDAPKTSDLLHQALKLNKLYIAHLLVSKNAIEDIFTYAAMGKVELLNNEINFFTKPLTMKDNYGFSLLHNAANTGQIEVAQILLSKGIDINIQAKNSGDTALHRSLHNGNLDFVNFIIDEGADINALNKRKQAPIHYAAIYIDSPDIIDLLVKKGANINQISLSSKYGLRETPLHLAASNGNAKTVKRLLALGADPLIKDFYGNTPYDLVQNSNFIHRQRISVEKCEQIKEIFKEYIDNSPLPSLDPKSFSTLPALRISKSGYYR
ncbi:MAG: ankyrin repeat domain-containing protein [Alphaproteobacteria bacterium]